MLGNQFPHARLRALFPFVLAAMLAACDDSTGGTGPARIPVYSVQITTPRDELAIGESHDFDALPLAASGSPLADRPVTWQSENETIATITSAGVLTARASGTVGILATSEGKTTRFEVRVIAPNAAPALAAITPGIIPVDMSTSVSLIATGTGFTTQSVIRVNGTPRTTEFVSSTELRTMITPEDARAVGVLPVTVSTPAPGGGTSTALPLNVELPQPYIDALQPSRIVMGWGMTLTVTISGSGFTGATRLFVDDALRTIDQRTASTITFRLTPADVRSARQIEVRVENAAPGGGRASVTFEVQSVPVASLEISAPSGAFWTWAGLRLPVQGIARSATNQELPDRVLQWSVVSEAVASIVPFGSNQATVTGNNVGITTIRADADDISAFAQVRVYERPDFDVLYSAGATGQRFIARWNGRADAMPSRIPLDMEAMHPAPSPDGRFFAFTGIVPETSAPEIFIARADGTDVRRLTTNTWNDQWPAWSPDGTSIAWVSARNAGLDIFTMRVDGSLVVQHTFARFDDPLPGSGQGTARPAWSPDSRQIAYTVTVNNRSQLWVMNANGSEKRRVAERPDADDFEPTWSADGRTIAFRRHSRTTNTSRLVRVDVASGNEVGPQFGPVVAASTTPAWSPDGQWLIMSTTVPGESPRLHAIPASEFGRGDRQVLPPLFAGGVRDARWIKR